MITTEQIIEAAKECGFEEHPYDEGHIVSNTGYTWIDENVIALAQHFYRQGLIDAAEKCEETSRHYCHTEQQWNGLQECLYEVRAMAEELK